MARIEDRLERVETRLARLECEHQQVDDYACGPFSGQSGCFYKVVRVCRSCGKQTTLSVLAWARDKNFKPKG